MLVISKSFIMNKDNKISNILKDIKELNLSELKTLLDKYCIEVLNSSLSEVLSRQSAVQTVQEDSETKDEEEKDTQNVSLNITQFPTEGAKAKSIKMSLIRFIKENDEEVTSLLQASTKVKTLPVMFLNLSPDKAEELKKKLLEISDQIKFKIQKN